MIRLMSSRGWGVGILAGRKSFLGRCSIWYGTNTTVWDRCIRCRTNHRYGINWMCWTIGVRPMRNWCGTDGRLVPHHGPPLFSVPHHGTPFSKTVEQFLRLVPYRCSLLGPIGTGQFCPPLLDSLIPPCRRATQECCLTP